MSWAIEEKAYSQRRACSLIGLAPKSYRYASRRPDDAEMRRRLRALASERRRFGYRRLHILLKRESIVVNHKKLFRLYREERLTVRRRGGRKRALGTRAPMTLPQGPNQRWSLDFVADQLVDGCASAYWWWSTTSRGNASRSSSTRRSPASEWCESSIPSSGRADDR